MFNKRIEIREDNGKILFVNALIENLRYALISLDAMFSKEIHKEFGGDKHTFYFFYMQSLLTAQGNIWNILFNNMPYTKEQTRRRVLMLQAYLGIDVSEYPLVGNKAFRNSSLHFDERYDRHKFQIGDFNIIDENTDLAMKEHILATPHFRTIDTVDWIYWTYDGKKQEPLDLRQLRDEMYDLLSKLCDYDIRIKESDCWEE